MGGSRRCCCAQTASIPDDNLRWALAGLAACVVAVGANHIVLAPMVSLARGHSLREAGVFSFESLSTDFILATLGLAVAAFWDLNPWLIPFAVAPLLLIHRSLAIPQLQAEARVDSEDRSLQRPALRLGDAGGARARAALPAADGADHGRPRPAARHQQHLRPPRRRRRPARRRGGLPPAAAPLRRAGALRRRGVLDPPAGDAAGAGVRDRRPDPPLGRGAPLRGRDLERADPRHHLDGRRRVPARRPGRHGARAPGRPRRLSREAPGTQPRPRRVRRAAARPARQPHASSRLAAREQRARRRRSPRPRRSSPRSSAARPHARTSRPCRGSSRCRVAWRSSSASSASWAPPRASRARSSARRPT